MIVSFGNDVKSKTFIFGIVCDALIENKTKNPNRLWPRTECHFAYRIVPLKTDSYRLKPHLQLLQKRRQLSKQACLDCQRYRKASLQRRDHNRQLHLNLHEINFE